MQICPYTFADDQEYKVEFRRNGELHRDPTEGPAYVEASEHCIIEEYFWKGHKHREEGPAERWWDRRTGQLSDETYWWHGQVHRDPSQGPALLVYDKGVLRYEAYYFRSKFYRDPSEGPSRIWRDEQGNICRVRHSMRKDLSKAKQMLDRAAERAHTLSQEPQRRPFSVVRKSDKRTP